MILKSLNMIMAYVIACIFVAVWIALTLYLPQMSDPSSEVTKQLIVTRIASFSVIIVFWSLPVVFLMGIFAFFKKIKSPAYYALVGIASIFVTSGFVEVFQGIEGTKGEWVPFVSFIAAAIAGYLFWFLTIRRPTPKTQQTSV